MYLHIIYNDGSNPFVMLNTTKKAIEKELSYQLSPWRNLYRIKYFDINGNITIVNAIQLKGDKNECTF